MEKLVVIAIDGPAGAGKSTIARAVAARLGYLYIDTGAMYRAVAYYALKHSLPFSDVDAMEEIAQTVPIEIDPQTRQVFVQGEDVTEAIRTPEVSAGASKVSAISGVRQALVQQQRRLAAAQSVVMEGRDIGSVVFPAATVKIFLDADPDERAGRRVRELQAKRVPVSAQQVTAELLERDARDRSRAESPLLQAPDAIYLDSTGLSLEEVEEAILRTVRERISNGKEVLR